MYGYDQKAVRRLLEYANCALKLEHKIVAMKFLFTEEEFEAADVPKLSGKMSYWHHGNPCWRGRINEG